MHQRSQGLAAALEARSEQLCSKMIELDRLDNALAYRLPDASPLNLLELKPDAEKKAAK